MKLMPMKGCKLFSFSFSFFFNCGTHNLPEYLLGCRIVNFHSEFPTLQ